MKKRLAKDGYLYLDDDEGFIEWCYDNPGGFFWNCGRDAKGGLTDVFTFHTALRHNKPCPAFRNGNSASGMRRNLTTTDFCKVVSKQRNALERWASAYPGYVAKNCTRCTGL